MLRAWASSPCWESGSHGTHGHRSARMDVHIGTDPPLEGVSWMSKNSSENRRGALLWAVRPLGTGRNEAHRWTGGQGGRPTSCPFLSCLPTMNPDWLPDTVTASEGVTWKAHCHLSEADYQEGVCLWMKMPHSRNTPIVRNIVRSAREREWKRGRTPIPNLSLRANISHAKMWCSKELCKVGIRQMRKMRFLRVDQLVHSHRVSGKAQVC